MSYPKISRQIKKVYIMVRKTKFTREMRARIVKEYEESNLTGEEIARKYGIKHASLIACWRIRLQEKPKVLCKPIKSGTFVSTIEPQMADVEPMKKRTQEELEAEVKRLTKELEWAQLQNKALNTLINIAEEQGIRIRKKSGAKQ